jgi:hypothetical protein
MQLYVNVLIEWIIYTNLVHYRLDHVPQNILFITRLKFHAVFLTYAILCIWLAAAKTIFVALSRKTRLRGSEYQLRKCKHGNLRHGNLEEQF